jgi:hypothetical protein
VTPEQAKLLKDAHFVLAKGVRNPVGDGRVPLHVWASWMTGAVTALGQAVSRVDEATKAQLKKDFEALQNQLAGAADIDLGDSPKEIADRLRAELGDRAAEVGALLAASE